MKKIFFPLTAILLLFSLNASLLAQDSKGKLSLSPNGGIMLPVSGSFDAANDSKDVFNTGTGFGFSLRYGISNSFALEGGFAYQWLHTDDAVNAVAGIDPAFVMQAITLNGRYNIETNSPVSPYITAGVGLYPWQMTDDGIGGDKLAAPGDPAEEFSKTSFGFNAGAGIEFLLSQSLGISAGAKYQFVSAKDEDKLGPDFGNQGYLNLDLGFTFFLSSGN